MQVAGPSGDKVAFLYDPSDYDIAKGWFPFRNNHFFVSSDKVRSVGRVQSSPYLSLSLAFLVLVLVCQIP